MNKVLLSVNNITIRLRDHFLFHNTSWELKEGEQWLIIGENGSGKTTFAKALAGLLPLKTGEIILHFVHGEFKYPQLHKYAIPYISFDTQQQFLKRDSLQRDFDAFVGIESPGTKVRDFLLQNPSTSSGNNFFLSEQSESKDGVFDISNLLDQDMITLSTGEMRKVFLMKALLQHPKILILDEPFDGLDISAKQNLMQIISQIINDGMHVILIVHKPDQIPEEITHIMEVRGGMILFKGERKDVQVIKNQGVTRLGDLKKSQQGANATDALFEGEERQDPVLSEILIDMQNVTVKYGDKIILDHISWKVKDGENWAILGHNGAGKSTLLQLITGDQLQKFANSISIFGSPLRQSISEARRKDDEISVWDIKKAIGIVSQDILSKHVYDMKAESVILSGFFDSIGLYKNTTNFQKEKTHEWITLLGLEALVQKNFQELSYGQKRLILITRAVVKSPKILILDEPCHGLDAHNRQKVLEIINTIGNAATNVLLVTHDPQEIVPCITNVLELEHGKILRQVKM